jgi:acyl-CoA thioester hydrolase
MPHTCTIPITVRYVECDPMGYLHHSNYLPYFEMGRCELLRINGGSYRDLEAAGVFFVVAKLSVAFKRPARFDDSLLLTTTIAKQTHVRIDHTYELRNAATNELLCTAETTIACIGRDGQIRPIPEELTPPPIPPE